MKRAIAIVDRTAHKAVLLLVALNLLFFLSFLVVTMLATGKAYAQGPDCKGRDMLASLQESDPASFEKIRADAAEIPNGTGLLWKIEKGGARPSFLFGTMHMTDPRVTTLPPVARKAFDLSGTVVIETTEILDQSKLMATLGSEPELMMFTDGTTLASLLSPEDAAIVDKALSERGIPPASVARMKPWMLSSLVALPACELARKAEGAPVLDLKLALDAKAEGKELDGLETAADQFRAMASLPIDFHMKSLVETLKLGDRMDDITETMIVLYQRGETGMFWPLFHAVLPDEGGDDGFAAFDETMVKARNHTMVKRAESILSKGNAFIAVGAMHLPGHEGLIELLRKDGYVVSAVN